MNLFYRKFIFSDILYTWFFGHPNESYFYTRNIFVRALGGIYLFVFLPIINQYSALLGQKGLLPVPLFLDRVKQYYGEGINSYWNLPTLFWINSSDYFVVAIAYLGLILAILTILGRTNGIILFILWGLQLSFYHIGQTFWGFGWETNLLEMGFLTIFFVPFWHCNLMSSKHPPSRLMIILYMWVLFRLMLGAGLIKIRHDPCWRDLTCLNYHYETQPIPNPLSSFFHHLPHWFQKLSVVINHIVEIIVPFFLFGPYPLRIMAGVIFFGFQVSIMMTGNYAWINYLTLVMILPCFDDKFYRRIHLKSYCDKWSHLRFKYYPTKLQRGIVLALFLFICFLSYSPLMNLLRPSQAMNTSYDQFHFVNSYGVFGSITKKRKEIIIKGTLDEVLNEHTQWKEYEIPCKPGDMYKSPCIRSPYHYRITWQIWFAAMGSYEQNPWLVHFIYKLLQGDELATGLLEKNPFPNLKNPPKYIKADLYLYHLAPVFDQDGRWYKREYIGSYLPPLSLDDLSLKNYIEAHRWPIYHRNSKN